MMMKRLLPDLFQLFFPSLCCLCHRRLSEGEELVCLHCLHALPYTHYFTLPETPLSRTLAGYSNIVSATAFLRYGEDSPARPLIHELKYYGNQELGRFLGRLAAHRLMSAGHPLCTAELIVPVPLHPRRQRERGYNQSECIAEGLSSILHIPVDTVSFVRTINTSSQTTQTAEQRQHNLRGAFYISRPEAIRLYRHILLVDDVSTTESTFATCVEAFSVFTDLHLSLFALAKTSLL
ncbi:MAG: ComF family protein [Tannerellaceae bacterium]|jgi:ComF family protein|nr:ComF family protein [Tannerellaceae bacterium]